MINLFYEWSLAAGIGGLALSVFVILFRSVIKQRIFPELSQKNAFGLLLAFLFMVWTTTLYSLYIYANGPAQMGKVHKMSKFNSATTRDLVAEIQKGDIGNIDYILLEKELLAMKQEIMTIKYSKHYPHLKRDDQAFIDSTKTTLDNLLNVNSALREMDSIREKSTIPIELELKVSDTLLADAFLANINEYRKNYLLLQDSIRRKLHLDSISHKNHLDSLEAIRLQDSLKRIITVRKREKDICDLIGTPYFERSNSYYIVGIQGLKIPSSDYKRFNDYFVEKGYRLNLNENYSERPSWLAYESVVLYYDKSNEAKAQVMACDLKNLLGVKFAIRIGAGLAVDDRKSQLFVHFIK